MSRRLTRLQRVVITCRLVLIGCWWVSWRPLATTLMCLALKYEQGQKEHVTQISGLRISCRLRQVLSGEERFLFELNTLCSEGISSPYPLPLPPASSSIVHLQTPTWMHRKEGAINLSCWPLQRVCPLIMPVLAKHICLLRIMLDIGKHNTKYITLRCPGCVSDFDKHCRRFTSPGYIWSSTFGNRIIITLKWQPVSVRNQRSSDYRKIKNHWIDYTKGSHTHSHSPRIPRCGPLGVTMWAKAIKARHQALSLHQHTPVWKCCILCTLEYDHSKMFSAYHFSVHPEMFLEGLH